MSDPKSQATDKMIISEASIAFAGVYARLRRHADGWLQITFEVPQPTAESMKDWSLNEIRAYMRGQIDALGITR